MSDLIDFQQARLDRLESRFDRLEVLAEEIDQLAREMTIVQMPATSRPGLRGLKGWPWKGPTDRRGASTDDLDARRCALLSKYGRVALLLIVPVVISAVAAAAPAPRAGDLDPTFGSSGRVSTDFGRGWVDGAIDVAVQPDRKLVVLGATGPGALLDQLALARYDDVGRLDMSFGSNGQLVDPAIEPRAMALQRDGKIVVAGWRVLTRYNANGTVDRRFGRRGRVDLRRTSSTNFGFDVAIRGDGKIVVAGDTGTGRFVLSRYGSSGRLDRKFGRNGRIVTSFGRFTEQTPHAIAIEPDSKIVVACEVLLRDGGPIVFGVARFSPNGHPDPTFGRRGKLLSRGGRYGGVPYDVAIQRDGKIVVAGAGDTATYGGSDFTVVRLQHSGRLDSHFGRRGAVQTDFGADGDDIAAALVIQGDGKLVVAGASPLGGDNGGSRFALARYLTNGRLDPSFGSDGKVITSFSGHAAALALARQRDGKLIAAGFASGDFALARYRNSASVAKNDPERQSAR